MPSKSQKQHDFMQAVLHSSEFADTVGVSQEVAQEFIDADAAAGLWQHHEEQENERGNRTDSR